MIPALLAAAGVVAFVLAALTLRSFGPGYRIGRLLAAAPRRAIPEAVALARSGERAYVRVTGRIDADDPFEDADHRPLVLRRTSTQWRPSAARGRGGWHSLGANTQSVPFLVRDGLDEIDVDAAELAEGLLVVPREALGEAADLGDGLPPDVPADAAARLVIEQVSAVEHATVAGVPSLGPGGRPRMGAGLGRPLILTTLEDDEAMRVLTGGATTRSRLAAALLIASGILLALALVTGLATWLGVAGGIAVAASPDPSIVPGSDTRSSGSGPGLVGDPAFAVLGVLGIAVLAVLATLAYVRLTATEPGPR